MGLRVLVSCAVKAVSSFSAMSDDLIVLHEQALHQKNIRRYILRSEDEIGVVSALIAKKKRKIVLTENRLLFLWRNLHGSGCAK